MTPRAMRLAALAPLMALTVCAAPPPPGEGGIPYLVTAARVIGPEARYVEAESVHRSRFHRLERMVLVDPAGTAAGDLAVASLRARPAARAGDRARRALAWA